MPKKLEKSTGEFIEYLIDNYIQNLLDEIDEIKEAGKTPIMTREFARQHFGNIKNQIKELTKKQ